MTVRSLLKLFFSQALQLNLHTFVFTLKEVYLCVLGFLFYILKLTRGAESDLLCHREEEKHYSWQMLRFSQLASPRSSVSPHGSQLFEKQRSDEHNAATSHDDEEVEDAHPAQLALNQ